MRSHPLVTIRFSQRIDGQDVVEIESHWYHVPRMGERVEVGVPDVDKPWISGPVRSVIWRELEGDVLVVVE